MKLPTCNDKIECVRDSSDRLGEATAEESKLGSPSRSSLPAPGACPRTHCSRLPLCCCALSRNTLPLDAKLRAGTWRECDLIAARPCTSSSSPLQPQSTKFSSPLNFHRQEQSTTRSQNSANFSFLKWNGNCRAQCLECNELRFLMGSKWCTNFVNITHPNRQ
jgi:hypothetical protein